VETADTAALFSEPLHPYTQALISANPVPDPRLELAPQVLAGEVPSPLAPPSGCHFHPRCPHATQRCEREAPVLREQRDSSGEPRQVACHLYDEVR
jgi:oligopeptide/dipeptide ABC transporter ATP-binding protein